MIRTEEAFEVPSEEALNEILERVRGEFRGHRHPEKSDTLLDLDTFDWRIARAGAELTWGRIDRRGWLNWTPAESTRARRALCPEVPAFVSDIANEALRTELEPLVTPRRLLVRFELKRRTTTLDIVDREEKTVCRVHAVCSQTRLGKGARWKRLEPRLVIEKLRGYDSEAAAAERFLNYRLGLRRSDSTLSSAAELLGLDPEQNPSALALDLDPDMPAVDALSIVFRRLLDIILVNRDGVMAETDTEFLHDLRVAVRRTRSSLAQMRQVFPAPVVEHFKREFRWLGSVTGPVRDFDVLLEDLPRRTAILGSDDRRALQPLTELIVKRRAKSQAELVDALNSRRFAKLTQSWSEVLATESEARPLGANTRRPVLALVRARGARRHAKLLARGTKLLERGSSGPEAGPALHALRIEAKKLRYLLECFRSLFSPAPVTDAIRRMKRLQSVLGDFNDNVVQEQMLRSLADERPGRNGDVALLLALGAMNAEFESQRVQLHRKFEKRFAEFASRDTARTFRALLGRHRRTQRS